MNSIDAIVIATGNDWRAVEAARARLARCPVQVAYTITSTWADNEKLAT